MSSESLDSLLRHLHRQLLRGRLVRIGVIVVLVGVIPWGWWLPETVNRTTLMGILGGMMVLWIMFAFGSVRQARALQAGRTLLGAGQLDDARTWLERAMKGVSLTPATQLTAAQQLAALLFRREHYTDVVSVCRALLRHRLRRLKHLWVTTRLLLADSLLRLDRMDEAYEAMRPVYDVELSLADRMRLLPIQLRYELASDHAGSAVKALSEKVRLAELLDSQQAALVHALLAEACRRESMPAEQTFLAARAWLYWDIDELAPRFEAIAPIARSGAPGNAR